MKRALCIKNFEKKACKNSKDKVFVINYMCSVWPKKASGTFYGHKYMRRYRLKTSQKKTKKSERDTHHSTARRRCTEQLTELTFIKTAKSISASLEHYLSKLVGLNQFLRSSFNALIYPKLILNIG